MRDGKLEQQPPHARSSWIIELWNPHIKCSVCVLGTLWTNNSFACIQLHHRVVGGGGGGGIGMGLWVSSNLGVGSNFPTIQADAASSMPPTSMSMVEREREREREYLTLPYQMRERETI
jgi:hypothetical protein